MSTQQRRKVAVRAFAAEVADATEQYKESDEDRAPNLALLPTGAEANRIFLVGTLTEREDVGNDSEYYHARVVDPTGTFHVYAGQYQPDAMQTIRRINPPEYVAVTGKVSRYELDDGDYNVTIRPEYLTVTDQDTRNRWVVEAAERTLDRIRAFDPEDGVSGDAMETYSPQLGDYEIKVRDALNSI